MKLSELNVLVDKKLITEVGIVDYLNDNPDELEKITLDDLVYTGKLTQPEVIDYIEENGILPSPTMTESLLKELILQCGVINLTNDIDLESQIEIRNEVILNLNGYTLKTTKDNVDVVWVVGSGQLTINGDGVIDADSSYSVYVGGNGQLTINGGTYYSPVSSVYAQTNAKVIINDGTFKVEGEYGQIYTLNLRDKATDTASIVVNGGRFYKYNPSQSESENPIANFVADDCAVHLDGDWYVVNQAK